LARLPFPIRLLVVGDGPMRSFLEQAPLGQAELDLRGTLPTEALPDLYAEMDALVLPSRTMPTTAERFGKVLIEAMACGTPVIGSSSGQIPWVIETAGGGIVFPEGDVEELARSIESLCLRSGSAQAARRHRKGSSRSAVQRRGDRKDARPLPPQRRRLRGIPASRLTVA